MDADLSVLETVRDQMAEVQRLRDELDAKKSELDRRERDLAERERFLSDQKAGMDVMRERIEKADNLVKRQIAHIAAMPKA